jgi:stage II sporulation protein D
MTGASWGAAALVMLQLTGTGALPKEITVAQVAPYATGQPVRVLLRTRAASVVKEISLEDYVAGVVAAETPSSFPLEAMKAQAIAARTYTLFHLGDHTSEGADLCSEVHCQAFHGLPAEDSRAYRAVRETAGQVLVYGGLLLDAQYSAACSGHTVAAWDTRQGKLLPYLCGADDRGEDGAYCAQGHDVMWSKRFSYAEAQRLVSRNLKTVLGDQTLVPGKLLSLRIAERAGNRVHWFEVKTTTGTYRLLGDAVRWLFGTGLPGPSGLRSTRFDLKVLTDRKGYPRAFLFTGAGHGHGIGMCQWGARGRALAGQTALEILETYYPGAEVWNLR